MKTDRERAPIMMRRGGGMLFPVGRFDQERLAELPEGPAIEVSIKRRRSNPQNALYWATLAKVVEATDAYPSAEKMHEAIKFQLGFTMPAKMFDGRVIYLPDSTAFARMSAAEFKQFFDSAMKLLAETYGFDPLAVAA